MTTNSAPSTSRTITIENLGIVHGEYQLQRLLQMLEIDLVFDIGANIGQYGLQLRKQVGYMGRILSFEPIPVAAAKIRLLASLDPLWEVRECAVDHSPGRTAFNIMVGDQFSSLLRPNQQFEGRFYGQHAIRQVIEVEAITLADALRDAPEFKRGLLKLDTQGTELRIIEGAPEVLSRFPAVQLEVGFQTLYENQPDFCQIVLAFESWGYRPCALFPNNQGHFPHLLEMDAIFLRNEFFPELK
jgi:FkbM family methyltransferase